MVLSTEGRPDALGAGLPSAGGWRYRESLCEGPNRLGKAPSTGFAYMALHPHESRAAAITFCEQMRVSVIRWRMSQRLIPMVSP